MQLKKTAAAGTMESGDIMITIDPRESGGIALDLTSNVMQQFGRQIEAVIRATLADLGVEHAEVQAVDKGALDCTVRARVSAAAFRSAERTDYQWEAK
ncbi:MAG: citrate lyase acyl carrier protein [Oscillospiraceae bacterium]|nr:citrate lyase acyl carrier protein [Oscillospiraceae bacterium]